MGSKDLRAPGNLTLRTLTLHCHDSTFNIPEGGSKKGSSPLQSEHQVMNNGTELVGAGSPRSIPPPTSPLRRGLGPREVS